MKIKKEMIGFSVNQIANSANCNQDFINTVFENHQKMSSLHFQRSQWLKITQKSQFFVLSTLSKKFRDKKWCFGSFWKNENEIF